MRKLMLFLLVGFMGVSCFAELKLARLFSDGMVLQRDQAVPVWGWRHEYGCKSESWAFKFTVYPAGE